MTAMSGHPYPWGLRSGPVAAVLLVAGTVLWAAGCTTTGQAGTMPDDRPSEELPILWEKTGAYSRLTRPVRLVVRDRASLARVPLTEVPVDFDSQMILIAGLGRTPSSDMGIRIARVWREGSRIRVQERRIHPGFDDGPPALDPASPWTVVVVPRSDLNVEGYSAYVPADILGEHLGAR